MPQSSISFLVTYHPLIVCLKAFNFAEGVKKVVQTGFDPSKPTFVRALQILLGSSQKTWEHKIEAYRRWGLSEEEISSIFRKSPLSIGLSEKKIMCNMNFLVCKMGWQPAAVARVPVVLCYGLQTRIMPRCSVIRVLLLKGSIKADIPISSVLTSCEKYFLESLLPRIKVLRMENGLNLPLVISCAECNDDAAVHAREGISGLGAVLRNMIMGYSCFIQVGWSPREAKALRLCKALLFYGLISLVVAVFVALQVLLGIKQKTWEDKIEAFRRWGLSEEEILLIFRKNPLCMGLSEKNIMCSMNFLVCKMGWQPAAVARVPVVLCYGLETRIMPRCLVIRVLLLKGLIKADVPLSTMLIPSEKNFLERFVIKYQDQVPQLLDILHGKMRLTELGFGFDDKSAILD
ncbi:hypothetical protein GH714_011414 [Hevea brasiliensis]|uniref:Uncharacterized protein n=1 Tax=Hevea brasiliensis TaxID=3981 RepID=A0A6A6LID3_HEVBR|nr:hypothetical protein GH714_011414 [Hevea brasiliensis]